MKQRTLLSELGGKQLNFALRGRQVHAFRGGSAGFVLVALFFVIVAVLFAASRARTTCTSQEQT